MPRRLSSGWTRLSEYSTPYPELPSAEMTMKVLEYVLGTTSGLASEECQPAHRVAHLGDENRGVERVRETGSSD